MVNWVGFVGHLACPYQISVTAHGLLVMLNYS